MRKKVNKLQAAAKRLQEARKARDALIKMFNEDAPVSVVVPNVGTYLFTAADDDATDYDQTLNYLILNALVDRAAKRVKAIEAELIEAVE